MLVRNKRTGFVYAYSPAYNGDPEFEIFNEAAPEEPKEDFDVQAAARALLASRQLKPKRVIKDGVDTKQFVSAGS
jgi:hypothetical protein